MLDRINNDVLVRFNSIAFTSYIALLAKHGKRNINIDLYTLVNKWLYVAGSKLDEFNPQDLANSIWSLATLGHASPTRFIGEWIRQASDSLNGFNPQGLANSIWALAKLGHASTTVSRFIDTWVRQASGKLGEFNPQDLANSIWALAKLGYESTTVSSFIEEWIRQASGKLGEFNPQNLSNSIYALATLGYESTTSFIGEWITRASGKLDEFNPQELSNSIWALATLGYESTTVSRFIEEWIRQASGQLNEFNPQDLANSIWALAVISILHDNHSYGVFMIALFEKINDLDLDNIDSLSREQIRQSYYGLGFSEQERVKSFRKVMSLIDEPHPDNHITKSELQKSVSDLLRTMGIKFQEEAFIKEINTNVDIFIRENIVI